MNHILCSICIGKIRFGRILCISANGYFADMVGVKMEDFAGKDIADLSERIHADDLECWKTMMTALCAEFQKYIFEPFMQENRNDSSEMRGTGLGLAITKKLVDAMNGTIEVESRLGEGTTIRVVLEFEQAAEDTLQEQAAVSRANSGIAGILVGKHVLLCEDHPLNQEIARNLLAEFRLIVDAAEEGMAGLKLFENSSIGYFDAILMDIRMPMMNGYEAAQAIRSQNRPDGKTVTIIAMTADTHVEDVQHCLNAGMNAHIAKPIGPHLLRKTLAAAIRNGEGNVGVPAT